MNNQNNNSNNSANSLSDSESAIVIQNAWRRYKAICRVKHKFLHLYMLMEDKQVIRVINLLLCFHTMLWLTHQLSYAFSLKVIHSRDYPPLAYL